VKIFRQLLLVLAILAVSARPSIAQTPPPPPAPVPPEANAAIFSVNEATPTNPTQLTDTVTGTDSNNASLTFRLNTPPSHGTVTVDPSGSFTYTPDPEYIGADGFGFIANNGSLNSDEATVTINVTFGNYPPNAYPIYAAIPAPIPPSTNGVPLPPPRVLYGQLLGDGIEDDVLAYSTYSIVDQPHNGTVTVDPKNGQFTYTVNNTVKSGATDSFTYTVYDGSVYSLPATVSIVIGSDSVGFIADTVITNVEGADLANVPVYSPASVSGAAVDEAVDRANQRLYVLTANALNIYDITTPTNGRITGQITPSAIPSVTLSFAAERIALSLDGRTAYIGSNGQVTAINLYPEYVASKGFMPAYTYLRTYSFGMARDVAAMGVHPAGDRLYVVIDMDPNSKSLNIANALVLSDAGQGTDATTALANAKLTDYGFLTYLDISADLAVSQANQTPAKFVPPINLKDPSVGVAVLDIRRMAFSPDGNYALICGVGAQSPRITPFGVAPTSDAGTGGTLVVDVRRYTGPNSSTPPTQFSQLYLGYIPDAENGVNTATMIQQVQQKGATIIHPDLLAAGLFLSIAEGAFGVSSVTPDSGLGTLPSDLMALDAASAAYDVLWQTYQDYGNMQAYFDLYPRDMVGASGVAINHTGDFGVVTMQDTNNLGLLKLSLSQDLSGYVPGSNPSFNIARGTGKTVNGFDAALDGAAPTKTFSDWAYPQTVAFTSDDSRIFIGMANGGPTPNKTNQAGTADAFVLRTQRDDPNSVFLSNSPPPGYVLAGNGGFESPRLATTLQSFDSSYDLLSDQLKAYNRWNSLRPLRSIDPNFLQQIVSTDSAHLTIPGTAYKSDPTIPDNLNVGFFLPLSGIGYRMDTFGMPVDTTNFATRGVVTALEQMGLLWNQLYHNPGYQPPTGSKPLPANIPTITRPYFIIGLLSQPGGGIIQTQSQTPETLNYVQGTGNEADFPYFKLNSDEAFNFVPSAGPTHPTDNTGETKVNFDEPNTVALILLLLSDPTVTMIELDPYLLDPALISGTAGKSIRSDPRIIPHGLHFTDPKIKNTSRRDLSNHMHVTFTYSHVGLSIDSDNNGVVNYSADESGDILQMNDPNDPGAIISTNLGSTVAGIPDYADGYDLFSGNYQNNASAAFTPMIIRFPANVPIKNIQFSLTYDESDPSGVTRVTNPAYVSADQTPDVPPYLYTPASGSYRIWTKDGPQARQEAQLPGGDFIASGALYKATDLLANDPPNQGTDRSVTVYIEAVQPGTSAAAGDVNVKLTITSESQSSIATPTVEVPVTVGPELAVDANLDGQIHFASEDVDPSEDDSTSAATPFKFWVNDGIDQSHTVDTTLGLGGYTVQDAISPTEAATKGWQPNCTYDTIACTRQLEDFGRLWLNLGDFQPLVASGQYAIGLKWVPFDNATFDPKNLNNPGIKIFPAVNTDGGSLYLTSSSKATAQITGTFGTAIGSADDGSTVIEPIKSSDYDFVFPSSAFANLGAGNPVAHFIFEGYSRGQGELQVVVLANIGGFYMAIGSGGSVYFDLREMKELYERWTVDDDPINFDGLSPTIYPGSNDTQGDADGAPLPIAPVISTRLPAAMISAGIPGEQWTAKNPDPSAPGYILYVHGWNMEPWEKDAFAETAYKRLYWQGYRGRFGTFQWPTTVFQLSTALKSYDNGEYAAWQAAHSLENLFFTLNGIYGNNVYVIAHSMGNVVTGEALRLAAAAGSGQLLAGYVATQAAVPGSTWDSSLTTTAPLSVPVYWGSYTPNIYNNWINNGSTTSNPVAAPMSNFNNVNDYALGLWRTDQALKPDVFSSLLLDKAYYYGSSNLTQVPVPDLFARSPCLTLAGGKAIVIDYGLTAVSPTALHLASAGAINNQYEIMAYDSQPRSLALGAISAPVNGFATTVGLSTLWPADPWGSSYSEHPWHSAEFRFDNASQDEYWNELMHNFHLNPNHDSSP
jgi:Bacterial Ig domain